MIKEMKAKTVLNIVLITTILIILYGSYNVYSIFYSNYFDQLSIEQEVWIESDNPPTKTDILFWGFTDLKTILVAGIISIAFVLGFKKIWKR